jgi:hypothetical protein
VRFATADILCLVERSCHESSYLFSAPT